MIEFKTYPASFANTLLKQTWRSGQGRFFGLLGISILINIFSVISGVFRNNIWFNVFAMGVTPFLSFGYYQLAQDHKNNKSMSIKSYFVVFRNLDLFKRAIPYAITAAICWALAQKLFNAVEPTYEYIFLLFGMVFLLCAWFSPPLILFKKMTFFQSIRATLAVTQKNVWMITWLSILVILLYLPVVIVAGWLYISYVLNTFGDPEQLLTSTIIIGLMSVVYTVFISTRFVLLGYFLYLALVEEL